VSEEPELTRMADRLAELAAMLRDPTVGDERAAELAAEASDLATEAGREVERVSRSREDELRPPGQEELL
jgi:hypothetical protein